jgi:hypothetical protein
VWCESDSVAGVLYGVTDPWTIPLMPCGGFPSKTFLRESMTAYRYENKPVVLLYIGDFDPSGMGVDNQIRKAIDRYANGVDVDFMRCAVTQDWINELNLPTRPPKQTDPRTKKWGDKGTVEVEAIPPKILKEALNTLIEEYVDQDALHRLRLEERAERETLEHFMRTFKS